MPETTQLGRVQISRHPTPFSLQPVAPLFQREPQAPSGEDRVAQHGDGQQWLT